MIQELQDVADGKTPRLMMFLPPGSAKSTYVSKLFPAWWQARSPGSKLLGTSHTGTLAEKFSGEVQDLVRENAATLGYGLATDAKEFWRTTHGGEYRAAGVGAKITGFRADLAICDDLVSGAEAADSERQREAIWSWYLSELDSRLTPGAPVVLIMTRWHEDDVAGRLLTYQPGAWRVIRLPALAEANDDPLGRAPGDPLWSDDDFHQVRYSDQLTAKRDELERAGAARRWQALYQQNPRPPEGSMFKTGMIPVLDAAPAGADVCRAWDLAATTGGSGDPDWTAGVKLARLVDGRFVVLDVVRLRGGPDEVEATIANTADQDGPRVRVGLPQDPGQAGKQQVLYLTRRLRGKRVESSPETGDKETRAGPVASQCNVGNLCVVRGAWNAAFIAELRDFPVGVKDDQVDALSRAFSMVGIERRGPIVRHSDIDKLRLAGMNRRVA